MQTFFTFLLFFSSHLLYAQEKNQDVAYCIVFASCFRNDTVGLKINGIPVIAGTEVTSESGSDITHLGVYQDQTGVWVFNKKDSERLTLLAIDDTLLLEVMVNSQWTTFTINLKKGKIIFIDHCSIKEGEERRKKLSFSQHKKTIQVY